MWEILSILLVLILSASLMVVCTRRWARQERLLAWAAFAAHVFAAFALLWVNRVFYEGIGDLLSYLRIGSDLARYARIVDGGLSDVVALTLQRRVDFPFAVFGIGRSTGTMYGIAGLLLYVLDSPDAASLLVALFSFGGQLALYAGLKRFFDPALHRRLAIGVLLLPSMIFWTSGLVKEAIALAGLGWCIWGLSAARHRQLLSGGLAAAFGSVCIGLTKPYVLFPLILSIGVWLYWNHGIGMSASHFRVRPLRLVLAAAVSILGVVLLGELFPSYSVVDLGDQIAQHQIHGSWAGGGSYYEIADSEERTLVGQLAFAPAALVSTLFRPFVFEVSNATMLVSVLETTALTILFLRLVFRHGVGTLWARINASPILMASLTMLVLTSVGVGLSTTNLGTLSRYRVPIMPLYAVLLLLLDAPLRVRTVPTIGHRNREQPNITTRHG